MEAGDYELGLESFDADGTYDFNLQTDIVMIRVEAVDVVEDTDLVDILGENQLTEQKCENVKIEFS